MLLGARATDAALAAALEGLVDALEDEDIVLASFFDAFCSDYRRNLTCTQGVRLIARVGARFPLCSSVSWVSAELHVAVSRGAILHLISKKVFSGQTSS